MQVWTYLRTGRTSDAVVETVETVRADGYYYEVMEHLRGGDLTTLGRALSLEELGPARVAAIVEQLVHALDELHANGIVHRDLKPANILVREMNPIKVAIVDFGISSPDGRQAPDRNGTPPFNPPEFEVDRLVTPANDMWALGLSLIEFFSGTTLFGGLDTAARRTRVGDGADQRGRSAGIHA